MNIAKSCGLLISLAIIALLVVHLRARQTQSAAAILRIESEWVLARRELWSVRTRTARLRAPQRIRDRIERFDSDLMPPEMDIFPPRSLGVVVERFQ